MLVSVWGLMFEGNILGVRVLRDGYYYDVALESLGNPKLNPKALPCIQLMEYGDDLMTEEELYSGQIIEDGSDNEYVINDLRSFFEGKDVIDPKEKARIKKKLDEYRQKYYTFLPNNWLKDFAQFHLDFFEGNRNIYTGFNIQQRKLIQQYFRWRSRMVFDELKASTVLKKGINKAKQLRSVMGDADDWFYDGTVDTGFHGGSHCELGHPLRYEHYAFSPSINRHIIFGATCISDFFELDKKVIDTIMKAQETILKEIKAIVFIMRTGRLAEYKKPYAKLRDALYYIDSESEYTRGLAQFMISFDNQGLPLTRSMLMKFNDLVRDFDKNKILHDSIELVGSSIDPQLLKDVLNNAFSIKLAYALRSHLLINPQGSKQFIKQGFTYLPALQEIRSKVSLSISLSGALRSAKRELYFVKDGTKARLATVEEVASNTKCLFQSTLLGKEKLDMLEWLVPNIENYMGSNRKVTKIPDSEAKYASEFMTSLSIVKKAISWGISEGFVDELKAVYSVKGQVGSAPSSPSTAPSFATGEPVVPNSIPSGYTPLDEDLELDISRIVEAGATGKLPKRDFVFQIIDTIKKNKRMSPKQKKFVDEALTKIRQLK